MDGVTVMMAMAVVVMVDGVAVTAGEKLQTLRAAKTTVTTNRTKIATTGYGTRLEVLHQTKHGHHQVNLFRYRLLALHHLYLILQHLPVLNLLLTSLYPLMTGQLHIRAKHRIRAMNHRL